MAEKKKHDECNCEHEHDHCECGCEHDDDVVVLQDENGNEVPFHYVYNCEHEDKEYVFLQAAEDEDESIEIFEVRTVEEKGELYDVLDPVDDALYDVLYEKLLLAASEDCCCDDDDCDCHHEGHDEHCDCGCHHHDDE